MKNIAVNGNNDIFLDTNGKIAMTTTIEQILQTCEHVVKTIRGELVLHGSIGVPYFELIWNGSPNLIQAEAEIRTLLKRVYGVKDITDIELFVKNNVLVYNAMIKTIHGEAQLAV